MTQKLTRHEKWYQRLPSYHVGISKLHARRLHYLKQYRFVHAVWALPILCGLGSARGPASDVTIFFVATVTWLSLSLRFRKPHLDDPSTSRPYRPWWPNYNGPVTAGLVFCLVLMVLPSLAVVLDTTTSDFLGPVMLTAFIEMCAAVLVVSIVLHFFVGYLVAMVRLTCVWPRRIKRRNQQSANVRRIALNRCKITKENLYLTVLLSILGLITVGLISFRRQPDFAAVLVVLFIFSLPILHYRTPWLESGTKPLGSILPHLQMIFVPSTLLSALHQEIFKTDLLPGALWSGLLEEFSLLGFPGSDQEAVIATTCALYILTGATRLKGDVVFSRERQFRAAMLSIHGDARTYVDHEGYAASLINYVRRSNGGVIGITGLRGAGKTALLNQVLAEFKGHFAVVWVTAPVSQQEGFGFLLSVCRTICRRAIDDVSPVLYGRPRAWQQAVEEFFQRSRGFIVISVLVIGAVWLVQTYNTNQSELSALGKHSGLTQPRLVRIGSEIVDATQVIRVRGVIDNNFRRTFDQVVDAEQNAILGLIANIDKALTEGKNQQPTLSDEPLLAIVPIVSKPGFSVVRVNSRVDGHRQLVRRSDWMVDSIKVPDYWNTWLEQRDLTWDQREGSHIILSYIREFEDLFSRHWGSINLASQNPELLRFFRLQESFYRYVLGRTHFPIGRSLPDGHREVRVSFKSTVSSLQLIRGHPELEGHLEPEIAILKALLGANDPILRDQELASIVIFSAFLKAVDSEDTDVSRDYILTHARARKLRQVLARYLDHLNGSSVEEKGSVVQYASTARRNLERNLWAISYPAMVSMVPFGLLIVILYFGGTIWRSANFLFRAPLNARLLTLVRRSEDFLEFLDYSEGRETSRGFSLRVLALGAKRTLTSRPLSLQGLTEHYLEYVRILRQHYNGKLIVVIDELDKISNPQQVRDILRELKGALFEEGCYFLISISEDAARAFRARLSEARDIFESSFDDIVAVDYMGTEAARQMVQLRLASERDLPVVDAASTDILTMFSGGIPREIIRHLRESVMSDDTRTQISPRSIGLQILRSEIEKWRLQIAEAPFGGDSLVILRKNCDKILVDLETVATLEEWPARIGTLLESCRAILDPDNTHISTDMISIRETITDIASGGYSSRFRSEVRGLRIQIRQVAELQTCIRLLIINSMMAHVWNGPDAAWRSLVPNVVSCLRLVMQQPALAMSHLASIEDGLRRSKTK